MSGTKNHLEVSVKKKIIFIGWTLIGILFVGMFSIILIDLSQGEGVRPWQLVRGGKGGSFYPVALLPIFLILIAVGFFWIKRRFFSSIRKEQKQKQDESEH